MDQPRTSITDDLPPEVLRRSWRSGPERSRLLNSPAADWARPLRRRRLLTAGYVAAVLVQALGIALIGVVPAVGFLTVGLTAVAMILLIGSLNTATRGVIDLRSQHVDERQRQERGAAYETAYRLGTGIVLTALVTVIVVALAAPDYFVLLAAASAVFDLLLMLPTLVVAWTTPE